jgi:hypothetical protein
MVAAEEDETTAAALRQRRAKNVALALVLAGLVLLFYLVTIVKLTGNLS